MSQYKSAIRTQPPQEQLSNSKYAEQARQLQEFFPLWKNDGLFFIIYYVPIAHAHFFQTSILSSPK
jgi:hypothetical protein